MIWLRRVLAVVLGLVVILLFVVFVVLGRVNSTAGNPQFYVDRLREADIYNFMYNEALPYALNEVDDSVWLGDTRMNMANLKAQIVPAAKTILPPEWVQARVEDMLLTVMPYMTGDTDAFTVTIPLKERVSSIGTAMKGVLHDEATFNDLYSGAVEYATDEGLKALRDSPLDLDLTRDEVRDIITTLAPKDWLRAQMDGAIDQVVPYFTGDSEHFTVRIELKTRVDPAVHVVKDLLARPKTYDYIFNEVVAKAVSEQIAGAIQFPYGITVTKAEVLDALKQVLPQDWLQDQLGQIVDEAAVYLKSETDTFQVVVPLKEREEAALLVVEGLLETKTRALLEALRACSLSETADLIQNPPAFGVVPPCRPAGLTYEEFKQLLGIDFGSSVTQLVGIPMPDEIKFSLEDLRQMAGAQDLEALDKARKYVSEGWTFTDADLLAKLNAEQRKRLEDARGWVKNGFTFDEQDLEEWFAKAENGDMFSQTIENGAPDLTNVHFALVQDGGAARPSFQARDVDLETVRHWLGLGRKWFATAGWAILALLSLAIGFLGGRNWYSRLAWAAFPMMLASLIVFVAFGPVFKSIGVPQIREVASERLAESAGNLPQVFADKMLSVVMDLFGSFASGIANQALVILIITGLAFIGGLAIQAVYKPAPASPPEQPATQS